MRLFNASQVVIDAQAEMGRQAITDRLHYCYRCKGCARLITKLEVLEARAAGRVNLCPCGGRTISPTNATWWQELTLPRLWKLIIAIKFHLIAPAPEAPSREEQAE